MTERAGLTSWIHLFELVVNVGKVLANRFGLIGRQSRKLLPSKSVGFGCEVGHGGKVETRAAVATVIREVESAGGGHAVGLDGFFACFDDAGCD